MLKGVMLREGFPWVLGCAWLLLCGSSAAAQGLTVATKESPPFAYRDSGGEWIGISIDLWEAIAEKLQVEYRLVDVATPEEMVKGVAEGRFDLAISAISVTAEREARVDFSHRYYTTGLGVAVRGSAGTGIERILRAVFSWQFLTLVGSVVLALLVAGYLFWWFERRQNPQFAEGQKPGVAFGLWWSMLLLFGHKGVFPKSVAGRLLAAASMLVSILLLSVLTGAIASALTVGHFESVIRDASDLRHVRTLAVDGTSGTAFLRRERIAYESVASVTAGLEAVANERADALVHDAPLLEFEVNRDWPGRLNLLPQTFELQDYAIAVGQDSPLRERLNTALLEVRSSPQWEDIQYRYLRR